MLLEEVVPYHNSDKTRYQEYKHKLAHTRLIVPRAREISDVRSLQDQIYVDICQS